MFNMLTPYINNKLALTPVPASPGGPGFPASPGSPYKEKSKWTSKHKNDKHNNNTGMIISHCKTAFYYDHDIFN